MKKILLIIVGFICLILGGIGIFVPILPTTPFAIVAAICFSASSEKLYKRLLCSKFFGQFIRNYREKTGISLGVKIWSISFLWALLALSAVLINALWFYITGAVIGAGVTIHICLIKTRKSEKIQMNEEEDMLAEEHNKCDGSSDEDK